MNDFVIKLMLLLCVCAITLNCGSGSIAPANAKANETSQEPNSRKKSLQIFSDNVLKGYQNIEELKADLDIFADQIADKEIDKNQQYLSGAYSYLTTQQTSTVVVASAVSATGASVTASESIAAAQSSVADHSTNNQVEGIDEPDLMKSNGHAIYNGIGNNIYITDLNGKKIQIYSCPGQFEAIFLYTDKLIAILDGYGTNTYVFVFNINSDHSISPKKDFYIKGSYSNARLVNNHLHLITNQSLNLNMLTYNYFSKDLIANRGTDVSTYTARILHKKPEFIESFKNNIIHNVYKNSGNQIDLNLLKNTVRLCRMNNSNVDERLPFETVDLNSYTRITSVNLDTEKNQVETSGFFFNQWNSKNIYANNEALILTKPGYRRTSNGNYKSSTAIMAYEFKDNGVVPLGTQMVDGYLLNQFSMDVYKNNLRIATTTNDQWGLVGTTWLSTINSQSQVNIISLEKRGLPITGHLNGLGKNEQIYSVRYIGDKGYVVTFRRIDPFYVIDLSDAANPKVAGELKIPGFSSYLHPIDENTILGLGREGNQTKISLFDVSDPTNPLEVQKMLFDKYTQAIHDHKAFRFRSSDNTLILPFYSYISYKNFETEFKLLDLNVNGISEINSVKHLENSPTISRSMIIGGNLITRVNESMKSNDYSNMIENWSANVNFFVYTKN